MSHSKLLLAAVLIGAVVVGMPDKKTDTLRLLGRSADKKIDTKRLGRFQPNVDRPARHLEVMASRAVRYRVIVRARPLSCRRKRSSISV